MTEPATAAQDLLRDDIRAGGLDAVMPQLTDRTVGGPGRLGVHDQAELDTGRQRCGGPHPPPED